LYLQKTANTGSKTSFADNLNIAEGLGGTFNDFTVFCLTTVIRCAVDTRGENKEVVTEFIPLISRYLCNNFLPVPINFVS
jgi:hypothetical protein